MKKLLVSPAPHIHSANTTRRMMLDVVIALIPAMIVSVLAYGLPALTVLLVSVVSCVLFEYFIQRFILKTKVTINDWSAAVTGVLLALNLPACSPWWMILIGAIVAIGITKMTFGGLGQNIFNPALVARVLLLISFPAIMTRYIGPGAVPLTDMFTSLAHIDATSGATALSAVSEGLSQGQTIQEIFPEGHNYLSMLFFGMGGSAGEMSALALLLGFVYLLVKKVIKPHIPLAVIGTMFVVSGIFWSIDPSQYTDPLFNILTGGALLGAIYMATDYVTSPMEPKGMIIFGIGIGVLTMFIRYFGAYPEGMSFAILLMNAVVPLINKFVKAKRFSKEAK